jgi:hypothetical protein
LVELGAEEPLQQDPVSVLKKFRKIQGNILKDWGALASSTNVVFQTRERNGLVSSVDNGFADLVWPSIGKMAAQGNESEVTL